MRFKGSTDSHTCRKVNVSVDGTLEATDVVVDGTSLRDRVVDVEQRFADVEDENQELRTEVETLKEQVATLLSLATRTTTTTTTETPTTTTTETPTPTTTTTAPTTTEELEVYEGDLKTDEGSFSEAICDQFQTGEHRNVGRITGGVFIEYQGWLSDMSCFQNIREIGGYLTIASNNALTNIDGLSRYETQWIHYYHLSHSIPTASHPLEDPSTFATTML